MLQTASRFATHGSYRARRSGTTLHLCKTDGGKTPYADKVSAIRPAAVVWPFSDWATAPSVPGVKVLVVRGGSWEARVGGLQDAESRGHKTVAVVPGWLGSDFKPLSDHITARRDPAATDVWLLWDGYTDALSEWQQQLDKDSRYRRIN